MVKDFVGSNCLAPSGLFLLLFRTLDRALSQINYPGAVCLPGSWRDRADEGGCSSDAPSVVGKKVRKLYQQLNSHLQYKNTFLLA